MDPGILHVLGDGIDVQFPIPGHRVQLDLLGPGDELADDHGMFPVHLRCLFEVLPQLLITQCDAHGCPAQYVARADEDRVADLFSECLRLTDVGKLPPLGLINAERVKEVGEFMPVLRPVDVPG